MLEVFLTSAFDKESNEGITSCLDSNTVAIFSEDEITEYIDISFDEIMTAFEEFCKFELFWTLIRIIKLDVLTAKYNLF